MQAQTDVQVPTTSPSAPSADEPGGLANRIYGSLSTNPYFSAGAGLAGIGIAMSVGKRAAIIGNALFRRRFVTSLQLNNEDAYVSGGSCSAFTSSLSEPTRGCWNTSTGTAGTKQGIYQWYVLSAVYFVCREPTVRALELPNSPVGKWSSLFNVQPSARSRHPFLHVQLSLGASGAPEGEADDPTRRHPHTTRDCHAYNHW